MSKGSPSKVKLERLAREARKRELTEEEIHSARATEGFYDISTLEQRHIQRGYYGALDRQNISYNAEEKCFELQYYASDNPNSARIAPLRSIATLRAEDDRVEKTWFFALHFISLLLLCLTPFLPHVIALALKFLNIEPTPWTVFTIILFALIVMVILIVVIFILQISITKKLKDVDNDWTTAINQVFSISDIKIQMIGIRRLMLKFRQLIKWRRFSNFYLYIFGTVTIIAAVASTISAWYLGFIQINEILFVQIFFLLAFGTIVVWRFIWLWSNVRVEFTEWRDPTVVLSVMIAVMHQRSVEQKLGLQTKTASAGNAAIDTSDRAGFDDQLPAEQQVADAVSDRRN